MKLTAFLVLAACLQVSTRVYSQKVSLSLADVSLEKVFKEITRQTGYSFLYTDEVLHSTVNVDIRIRNVSLDIALEHVFRNQPLTWSIVEKTVVVQRKQNNIPPPSGTDVRGHVTDSSGKPMAGVTVTLSGSRKASETDADGAFTINVPENAQLHFSFVGYEAIDLPVDGRTDLNVTLQLTNTSLNDIVLIGYGSQRRKDIVSAISTVSVSDVSVRPVVSAAEVIAGKAPGIQVLLPSGKPGADFTVFVRGIASLTGNTQPLYVIDGVVSYDTHMLDPNTIASISILKDASAAGIYGAAGSSNGVVLITTKKGVRGKTRVVVNAYTGAQEITKKIRLLNSSQLAALLTEEQVNSGNTGFSIPDTLVSANNNNWQDLVYRRAQMTGINAGFSGGGDKGTVYFGLGYTDQDGIAVTSNYKRYSTVLNIEQQISPWLAVGSHVSYNRTGYHDVYDNQRAQYNGFVLSALNTPPFSSIYNTNGDGTYGFSAFSQALPNPLGDIYGTNNYTIGNNLLGTGYAQIRLPFDVTLRSQIGVTLENGYQTVYQDPRLSEAARQLGGIGSYFTSEAFRYIWDNTLTFDRRIKKHSIDVIVGTSASKQQDHSSAQSGYGSPSSSVQVLSAASTYTLNQTYADAWTLESFFGRLNYAYDDKYLLSVSLRRDGSSKLGIRNQWADFPAFSAGWRASQENFLKDLPWLSDFKIRTGWGATGNLPADLYPSYSQLNGGNNYAFNGTTLVAGTLPSGQAGNPGLLWEETKQFNTGLDLAVLDNRVSFSADYYIKRTHNLILNVPQPQSTGVITKEENMPGYVQNKGFEFLLSADVLKGKGFNWTSSLNMSFNTNVVSLPAGTPPILTGYIQDIGGNAGIVKSGLPLGSFWGYINDGVNPQTGNIRFRDLNKDGRIDPDNDRTFIGSALPRFTFGFSNTFSYHGFDLSVLIDGVHGNKIFDATRMETEDMTDMINQTARVLRRWKKPGDITDIPKAMYGSGSPAGSVPNYSISSRWVESGSFLRFRQMTLAYDLDKKWLAGAAISGLRLYVTLQNMFIITGYKGYSPELNVATTSNVISAGTTANLATQQGFDHGTYPQARSITFGLNVSL
ncbi:MAG TPA: TonB-dependent receptor [Puia sp.]|jgi:TonB-linked SusC/RagA family outer membrane protein